MLKSLSDTVVVCIGVAIGLLAGWALTSVYTAFVTVPEARTQATATERASWVEKLAGAQRQADVTRKAQQARIDMAETRYLEQKAAADAAHSELEVALASKETTHETPDAPGPRACVAISRGVSIALDHAGRPGAKSP